MQLPNDSPKLQEWDSPKYLRQILGHAKICGMSKPTRTRLLLEERISGDLAAHIRPMRRRGDSWHVISIALAQQTGIAVTPETLRGWFATDKTMRRQTPENAA